MRTPLSRIILAAALLAAAAGSAITFADAPVTAGLPASLDQHYPPQAQGPAFWLAMHGMSVPFSAFVSDLMEGDATNATANFSTFRQRYLEVANMVPEWTPLFPVAPLDEAAAAIESGDQARVMAAVQKIGQTCHSCHVANMPAAYFRYHWGDFTAITATDPVTKQDVPFPAFMQMLDGDLIGVGNDLAQGQPEAAAAHARALGLRYAELKETCTACHETPRHYYVDDAVMKMIGRLEAEFADGSADPRVVEETARSIGVESCGKCHLVHVPAAYMRAAMGGGR